MTSLLPHSDIYGLKVLVVESAQDTAKELSRILLSKGADVLVLETSEQARRHFSHFHPNIAICEMELADGNGLELLKEWRQEAPSLPIILLAQITNVECAVTALRAGAFDIVSKPLVEADLTMALKRASEVSRLRTKVIRMQGGEKKKSAYTIIGSSNQTRSLVASLKKIATSKCDSCIIYGESGVGKELAAHQIHEQSARSKEPYIEINAASIPDTLLESELFGHERGAYTDAKDRKAGLLEIAGRGTVFLDEIGELPLNLQAKLLRVLESRKFKRLGGVKDIELNARIVSATNRNLAELVAEGRFRKDLFYRLNVIPVQVPPLRDRPEDIVDLAEFFLKSLSKQLEVEEPKLPPKTIQFLKMHSWSGNVRELKNVIYRSLVMFEPDILLPKHLILEEIPMMAKSVPTRVVPVTIGGQGSLGGATAAPPSAEPRSEGQKHGSFELPTNGIQLENVEESLIKQALARAKHNQTKAASLLGISRHALRYRLEKYGLVEKR